MKLVIIESPYAGDIEANTAYARLCVRDSLRRGESPIASHLLYPQPTILDENVPEERAWGIKAGLAWLPVADLHVFYTDRGWSNGMLSALHDYNLKQAYEFRIRSLSGNPKLPATLHPEIEKLLWSYIEA